MKAFPNVNNCRKKYFEEFQRDQRITEQDWRRSQMTVSKNPERKRVGQLPEYPTATAKKSVNGLAKFGIEITKEDCH